jgi:hypothetical protein
MQNKGFYRKINSHGPGGWKCACCAPPPGKGKKKDKRIARKTFSDLIKRIEN